MKMEGERFPAEQTEKKFQSPALSSSSRRSTKQLSKLRGKRSPRVTAGSSFTSRASGTSKLSGSGGVRKYKRRRLESAKRRVVGKRLASLSPIVRKSSNASRRRSLFALSIPAPDFEHLSFEHDPHNQSLAQSDLLHCVFRV